VSDFTDDITDYGFPHPESLIAQRPIAHRPDARLLLVRREPETGLPRFEDLRVSDLPEVIAANPKLARMRWVRNRSAVLPARFYAQRESGARHEIVLIEEKSPRKWEVILRNSAKLKFPETLRAENSALELVVHGPNEIEFQSEPEEVAAFLALQGEMPLPPYIKARLREEDRDRYQTIWADRTKSLSAAAPTASLHFDEALLTRLVAGGVRFEDIYLHVGLGTFEPLRQPKLSAHTLHEERFEVEAGPLSSLRAHASGSSGFLAVGTTALRTLESLSLGVEPPRPDARFETTSRGILGRTRLFVRPGFEFRYTRALWTNFHLPESTLFVLVATFAGSRTLAKEAYSFAVAREYRLFSYGDATLWI